MDNNMQLKLQKKPNAIMAMNPNISGPAAPGQKWHMKEITAINDRDYSSVNVSIM